MSDEDDESYEFTKAIVYARKIELKTAPKRGSSAHRQQFAKLEYGYLIIEERWGPPSMSRR